MSKDKNAPKPVGHFKEEGTEIFVYTKKDETPEEAIARVAKRHDIPPRVVKRIDNPTKTSEKGDEGD